MALTVTLDAGSPTIVGNRRISYGSLAFDSSYPTGGEAVTARNFGLADIADLRVDSEDGYVFRFDKGNAKLMAYYADNDAGADGALIQVANEVNLSSITAARFQAVAV